MTLNEFKKTGPNEEDFQKARELSDILGEKVDILLYGSKKRGEVADLFNRVASAIAVLAFLPGGITIFGQHWENT
jgi:hypothetical protein